MRAVAPINRDASRGSALICACAFFFFFFNSYKLFDVERAELYLCVLRQLAVMYSSSPQHRSKMQQIYFPKLVKHSLEVLQEPSQQVQKFQAPHTFAGF